MPPIDTKTLFDRWGAIRPQRIAEECSAVHVANLLDDAVTTILCLCAALDEARKLRDSLIANSFQGKIDSKNERNHAMNPTPVYQFLAHSEFARENCSPTWKDIHEYRIKKVMESFPHGSGYDSGTKFLGLKNGNLIFETAFHHMNENGFYDGWTEHRVTVKPCLTFGFTLHISGRNRNGIKDMIEEDFAHCLSRMIVHENGVFRLEGLPPAFSFYITP